MKPDEPKLIEHVQGTNVVVANVIQNVVIHQHPSRWQRIDFSEQQGLTAPLAGASMGPRHVLACPPIKEVDDIVRALREHGAVAIVGESGTGKSMAAWHAARLMNLDGWDVYLLASASGTDLPPDDHPALLVVDDFQAYASPPISAASTNQRRAMLVVSNQPVHGFRRTIHIVSERAVGQVADGLLKRRDELLPILRGLDTHVGDGAFDISVERKIEHARTASKAVWQFMFNLGSGHLHLHDALSDLKAAPPLDTLVFAIAARQLATLNRGCEQDWLRGCLRDDEVPENLGRLLDEINARVPLVRKGALVSTPHPLVAARVLQELFYGDDASRRTDLFWQLFTDESVPIGGLSWLMSEAPRYLAFGNGLPDGLPEAVIHRCLQSADVAGAAATLAKGWSWWRFPTATLDASLDTIVGWLRQADATTAYPLSRLVNDLYNADKDLVSRLVGSVPERAVADWLNRTTIATASQHGALLDRLLLGAAPEWRAQLRALLDEGAMRGLVRAFGADEVHSACGFVGALAALDHSFSFELACELKPVLIQAMRVDVLEGFSDAQDVHWNVLGLAPGFLRDGYEPTEAAVNLAREVLEGVGAAIISARMLAARRRDWHAWASFSGHLREVAPSLASEVACALPVQQIIDAVRPFSDQTHDMDDVLGALALDERLEPAATLVRVLIAPQGRMSWKAAYIAPDAAATVCRSNGSVNLALGGGLPAWNAATAIVAKVASVDPDAARTMLQGNLEGLADGLIYRQSNGGEGGRRFLRVVQQVAPDLLLTAVRRVPVEQAEKTWPARVSGGPEEREMMADVLLLATNAGGGIARLAASLSA